jgi:hypothetical protein
MMMTTGYVTKKKIFLARVEMVQHAARHWRPYAIDHTSFYLSA